MSTRTAVPGDSIHPQPSVSGLGGPREQRKLHLEDAQRIANELHTVLDNHVRNWNDNAEAWATLQKATVVVWASFKAFNSDLSLTSLVQKWLGLWGKVDEPYRDPRSNLPKLRRLLFESCSALTLSSEAPANQAGVGCQKSDDMDLDAPTARAASVPVDTGEKARREDINPALDAPSVPVDERGGTQGEQIPGFGGRSQDDGWATETPSVATRELEASVEAPGSGEIVDVSHPTGGERPTIEIIMFREGVPADDEANHPDEEQGDGSDNDDDSYGGDEAEDRTLEGAGIPGGARETESNTRKRRKNGSSHLAPKKRTKRGAGEKLTFSAKAEPYPIPQFPAYAVFAKPCDTCVNRPCEVQMDAGSAALWKGPWSMCRGCRGRKRKCDYSTRGTKKDEEVGERKAADTQTSRSAGLEGNKSKPKQESGSENLGAKIARARVVPTASTSSNQEKVSARRSEQKRSSPLGQVENMSGSGQEGANVTAPSHPCVQPPRKIDDGQSGIDQLREEVVKAGRQAEAVEVQLEALQLEKEEAQASLENDVIALRTSGRKLRNDLDSWKGALEETAGTFRDEVYNELDDLERKLDRLKETYDIHNDTCETNVKLRVEEITKLHEETKGGHAKLLGRVRGWQKRSYQKTEADTLFATKADVMAREVEGGQKMLDLEAKLEAYKVENGDRVQALEELYDQIDMQVLNAGVDRQQDSDDDDMTGALEEKFEQLKAKNDSDMAGMQKQVEEQSDAVAAEKERLACLQEKLEGDVRTAEGRVDKVEHRADAVEGRMDLVEDRMDAARGNVDVVKGRMDVVEASVRRVEGRVDEANGRGDSAGGRMDAVEGRINVVEGREGVVDGTLDALSRRLAIQESKQADAEIAGMEIARLANLAHNEFRDSVMEGLADIEGHCVATTVGLEDLSGLVKARMEKSDALAAANQEQYQSLARTLDWHMRELGERIGGLERRTEQLKGVVEDVTKTVQETVHAALASLAEAQMKSTAALIQQLLFQHSVDVSSAAQARQHNQGTREAAVPPILDGPEYLNHLHLGTRAATAPPNLDGPGYSNQLDLGYRAATAPPNSNYLNSGNWRAAWPQHQGARAPNRPLNLEELEYLNIGVEHSNHGHADHSNGADREGRGSPTESVGGTLPIYGLGCTDPPPSISAIKKGMPSAQSRDYSPASPFTSGGQIPPSMRPLPSSGTHSFGSSVYSVLSPSAYHVPPAADTRTIPNLPDKYLSPNTDQDGEHNAGMDLDDVGALLSGVAMPGAPWSVGNHVSGSALHSVNSSFIASEVSPSAGRAPPAADPRTWPTLPTPYPSGSEEGVGLMSPGSSLTSLE